MLPSTARTRQRVAADLRQILTSRLFRALAEPMRVRILEFLTVHGRSDVAGITAAFPQDRSVISRHLAALHAAHIVRREKIGRQVFFEVDGPTAVGEMEAIVERFRRIVPLCCTPARRTAGRPAAPEPDA
jgi:DNA-binding transcriptional ArsR family regulator